MPMNDDAPAARDKRFWTQVRRGLLMVVRAIEERYDIQVAERP